MINIENVLICILIPLLIGLFCIKKHQRFILVFLVIGNVTCFLSAYVNSFFMSYYNVSFELASIEISPVVEEVMKFLPFLYYVLIHSPSKAKVQNAYIFIGLGFASFENICWLISNGSENLLAVFLRGFSAGAMHVVGAALISYGLLYVWDRTYTKIAGIAGLMCLVITFHGVYNLLLTGDIVAKTLGYILPILVFVGLRILVRRLNFVILKNSGE